MLIFVKKNTRKTRHSLNLPTLGQSVVVHDITQARDRVSHASLFTILTQPSHFYTLTISFIQLLIKFRAAQITLPAVLSSPSQEFDCVGSYRNILE